MGLFRRPRPRVASPLNVRPEGSLTASGFRIRTKDAEVMRRLVQPWQARSFGYYDQIPEIKYAAQFYARLLAPLRLYAAELDDDDDVVETTDPAAKDALARIQDPGGGMTGLLSTYGRLMFLCGECYLFVSTDPETGLEQWEMLSTDELRVMPGLYLRYKAPSLVVEEYREPDADANAEAAWVPVDDKSAVAYRLWQRHPRFSYLADSTMMGVLDVAEELLILTRAVRARARSRLYTSGILVVDERIGPPPAEPVPDEDMQEDPLLGPLIAAITAAIVDEGSAAAMAPILARVKAPENGRVQDLLHFMQFADPAVMYPETGLRYECVKRLAIGLDMPPEELLGLTEANHWTAWMVDETTWKAHGQPKAQQLCDDLTSAYYRPYLRDVLGMKDWERRMIAYDASMIINHPDRSKDAKDLHDAGAIGDKALRTAANFDEEDAPTEDERNRWLGVKIRDGSLAVYGIPSVKAGGIEPQEGDIVSAQGDATGATTGGEVSKGAPPSGPPAANGASQEQVTAATVARVLGASDLALLRAREAAGNRIRSLAKRDPELAALVDGTRSLDVAAKLGREHVRKLRVSERDLVSGAHELIVDAFRLYDIDPEIAKVVADTVEQHAARTLYDKNPPTLSTAYAGYVTALISGQNGHGS